MSDNKYQEIRGKIIDALKVDLMGPLAQDEFLDESPLQSYIRVC
ncbi:MAG: hypothetical protein SCL54_16700 [Bacillota bacterium]|nr:hypothetical protein [Bacillota bacterium]